MKEALGPNNDYGLRDKSRVTVLKNEINFLRSNDHVQHWTDCCKRLTLHALNVLSQHVTYSTSLPVYCKRLKMYLFRQCYNRRLTSMLRL